MIPTAERPFVAFKRYLPGDLASTGIMHVVDRVVGREMLLGPEEKDHFRHLLRRIAAFTGLELLTWTCLDNHFHLLLRVPNAAEAARLRAELNQDAVLARMSGCFSPDYIQEVRWRLEAFRREGKIEIAETILHRLREQMFDISAFMHMLKRRFSAWYNRRHGRKGTLWEGRFRSVLVEESEEALLRMAAYIDLNAVRAGIVRDPKDYRWSGYGEAVSGRKEAQRGIQEVVRASVGQEERVSWEEARERYGDWLCEGAVEVRDEEGKVLRKGMCAGEAQGAGQGQGRQGRLSGERRARLSRAELLHCRVRYFADGVAIGSRAFVESVFERYRSSFGPKRSSGARPMRYGDWAGLCSLRDLRKEVIGGSGSG